MALSYGILGPLGVWRDGEPVTFRAAKQRMLLAVLLLHPSGVTRDRLIDSLWGEQPPAGARNTLQVYVSSLRRALGRSAIETTPTGYRLCLEPDALDAERFEHLLRSGREALAAGNHAAAADTLAGALRLWRGPALVDFRYDGFAETEAGRLEELRVVCLEERIEAGLQLGQHAELVGELEALVSEQPLRERVRRQLILALYRSGRQSEALAQYQATRRMLVDEFGLEPSPVLRDLERMILAHDPGLAPAGPARRPPSNLPLQPTPFIGRERELAELVELVRGGSRRLVTLTGPGGSGKSRLAAEAASQLADDYEGGVWWVPLQSLTDPNLMLPTIAGAIGARGDIGASIGTNQTLLVLDNFEQLIAARSDVATILAECPGLQVVATSREPLNVAAEREFRVPPMTEQDAVALLDERAVESGSRETRVDVCRRLDCLPLAVELAAARTRAFTLEQILSRLDDRLAFLSGGPHDAPARQQTLRATIDWSYDLLQPEEKRLFERLGVFGGGWELAGAEAVCELEGASVALADRIMSLIEKSLVNREPDVDGESQYSMLETIRGYAIDRLQERGELRAVQRRHAEYFLALLERAFRIRTGEEIARDDDAAYARSDELPNLRAALTFLLDQGDLELALRLATAGGPVWGMSGAMIEGRAWMKRVMDRAGDRSTAERARALLSLGECERVLGNPRAATQHYKEARDLYQRRGDRRGVLQALIYLIELTAETKDPQDEALLPVARALANDIGNDFDRARLLVAGAGIETRSGDFESADVMLDEGLELMRSLGVPPRVWAWQLVSAGYTAMERQDFARARSAFEEYLAETSAKHSIGAATARCNLGLVALYEEQRDPAAEQLHQALVLARETGAKVVIAECLFGAAAVAALDGDSERAAQLWGAAESLKEEILVQLSTPEQFIVDRYLVPVRAHLADSIYSTARAEGAALSLDDAIVYALGGLS